MVDNRFWPPKPVPGQTHDSYLVDLSRAFADWVNCGVDLASPGSDRTVIFVGRHTGAPWKTRVEHDRIIVASEEALTLDAVEAIFAEVSADRG